MPSGAGAVSSGDVGVPSVAAASFCEAAAASSETVAVSSVAAAILPAAVEVPSAAVAASSASSVASAVFSVNPPVASPDVRPRYALYDTLQVLHNTLRLDLSAIGEATLRGRAEITLRSKQDNLAFAPFLLLGMQIDRVEVDGRPAPGYQYNDTLLRIPLDRPLQKGEEARVAVVYHGQPARARFGGFMFADSLRHAHNMGVLIDGSPHSFGRSWFPAVDDFRSRSTFDLYLRADTALQAVGSGLLQAVQPAPDGTALWHWQLRQPVPDYLVSVAVGPYRKISYPYTSLDGRPLPIDVYVFPDEVEDARETYAILPRTLALLETWFGPYAFDRVGYVSVDRRGGAMEHVANIAMPRHPRPTVDYRTVVIHELIHSWFGNRVTCRTAADMWLNEGITNFAPELVLEKLYGPEEAARYVRQNQWVALLMAPRMEKGYLSLADVPEAHTYGATVYDKGAMVMHTLRYYLGDEKLLPALKAYVEAYAFRTASVAEFQAFIARHTATDLTDFFDLWVNRPGFVAFEVDSIRGRDTAHGFEGTVYIEQKRCHAPAYGRNVRLPLTFYDAACRRSETREVVISGPRTAASLRLPFRPAFALADPGYALCKASLYEAYRADTAGTYTSRLCRLTVEAEAVSLAAPEGGSSTVSADVSLSPLQSVSSSVPESVSSSAPAGVSSFTPLPLSSSVPGSISSSAPEGGSSAMPAGVSSSTLQPVSSSVPAAVSAATPSSLAPVSLHLEYYRVAPDPIRSRESATKYRLCDTHYWRVSGRVPDAVRLTGRFPVATEGPEAAWLDAAPKNNIPAESEISTPHPASDTICLMYRRDAADDWRPVARIPRVEAPSDTEAEAEKSTTRKAAPAKPGQPRKGRPTPEREIATPLLPGEYCLGAGK